MSTENKYNLTTSEEYKDATDGDIYLNPFFGDLWVVKESSFVKINNGYTVDLDDPKGFIKVGHIGNVITKGGRKGCLVPPSTEIVCDKRSCNEDER